MNVWYVLLIVAAVAAFLLSCPVTVFADYSEQLSLRVGYLFFWYSIVPKKQKKKKAEEKKTEAPKENSLQKLYRERGLSGFLTFLGKAAEIASGAAREIFSHTVFSIFRLNIRVCGEDAAEAALNYGRVCGVVSSGVGLLLGAAKCRECRTDILPDFSSQESSVSFSAKARVAAFFLLKAALRAFFRSLKMIKAGKAAHTT